MPRPCELCAFVETDDGSCICRVPTEDDVPLWEEL
jgi:hypothetical protein